MRWIRLLPGSWTVQNGITGTTPVTGQAYGALGAQVAAIGSGLTVSAYRASTGQRLWTTQLTGFAPGSAITAVRVWPGVVTVGVRRPGGGRTAPRAEVVLRGNRAPGPRVPGRPVRRGGAAAAATTVIVGPHAVTSYANRTGAVRWSRPTGPVPQDWQVDGANSYVAVAAGGYLGSAPVTALRRINLATGAQRVVRPHGPSYAGTLSLAYQGVVVFSSARRAKAYSGHGPGIVAPPRAARHGRRGRHGGSTCFPEIR